MPSSRFMFRVAQLALAAAAIASTAGAQTSQRPVVRDIAAELACGPGVSLTAGVPALQVVRGTHDEQTLFAPGDIVIINGGTAQGVRAGQDYFVRRRVPDRFVTAMAGGLKPQSVHTAGWIRITEAQTNTSVATITHGCDGVIAGDYLEPFAMPAVPPGGVAPGQPDYTNPGHVVLADDRQQLGGPGSLMIFDRGSYHGLRTGQALTVFKEPVPGGPAVRIGRATVVIVGPEASLMRIDESTEAVNVGDLVAIHR